MATTEVADEADTDERPLLDFLAGAWSWMFLAVLLDFFESWARAVYGISFLFNGFNILDPSQHQRGR